MRAIKSPNDEGAGLDRSEQSFASRVGRVRSGFRTGMEQTQASRSARLVQSGRDL